MFNKKNKFLIFIRELFYLYRLVFVFIDFFISIFKFVFLDVIVIGL